MHSRNVRLGSPVEWPRPWFAAMQRDLGLEGIYTTRELDRGVRYHAVFCSRLGVGGERQQVLRSVEPWLRGLERGRDVLLIGVGTTLEEELARIAKHARMAYRYVECWVSSRQVEGGEGGARVVDRVGVDRVGVDRARMFARLESWRELGVEGMCVQVSPRADGNGDAVDEVVSIDRCLAYMVDRLVGMRVRKRGRVERALVERLRGRVHESGSVMVWVGGGRDDVQAEVARSLMEAGAVGWWHPRGEACGPRGWLRWIRSTGGCQGVVVEDRRSIEALMGSGPWLTHCTRGRRGSWPDQGSEQQVDEAWLGGEAWGGPWLTLARILQQRRLIAGTYLRKGETPTVCFSARPLMELLASRVYRKHLHRWDWEPYGVCLREKAARGMGIRPVAYGDGRGLTGWEASQIPFFQVQRGVRSQRDWEGEAEWRGIGDVRLRELAWWDAFVFVPTMTEARWIARLSPFPVVPLEALRPS